jgi:hypothetical protein
MTYSTEDSLRWPSPEDALFEQVFRLQTGGRPGGQALYFGEAGEDENRVYLGISLWRGAMDPVSSLTLVTRVFQPASAWRRPEQRGATQILPLLTFQQACQIDPVVRDAENPYLFILTGRCDGRPFRFELSVGAKGDVVLVEASQPPLEKPRLLLGPLGDSVGD